MENGPYHGLPSYNTGYIWLSSEIGKGNYIKSIVTETVEYNTKLVLLTKLAYILCQLHGLKRKRSEGSGISSNPLFCYYIHIHKVQLVRKAT